MDRPRQSPASPKSGIFQDAAWRLAYTILCLIFGNPFARLMQRLEALLTAFRNGTLKPAPLPAPRPAAKRRHRRANARTPSIRRPRPAPATRIRVRQSYAPSAILPLHPQSLPPRIERPPRRAKMAPRPASPTHAQIVTYSK